MNITKFPQSCLLITNNETRIVIDPGELFTAQYERGDLGELDAVLYTHIHPDHLDAELAATFSEEGVPLYGNSSVIEALDREVALLEDGDTITIEEITVEAHDLPHCVMVNGDPGPQNTGFVINDMLFHPGDGTEIDGLNVENVAVPIAGPSVSPNTAFSLAKQVGAQSVIPIHYDYWIQNADIIKERFEAEGLAVHVLDNGDSVEL